VHERCFSLFDQQRSQSFDLFLERTPEEPRYSRIILSAGLPEQIDTIPSAYTDQMHPRRLSFPLLCFLTKHEPRLRLLTTPSWQRTLTTKPSSPPSYPLPNLHRYTRGRWLIDDNLERKARYVSFNLAELCAVVITNCSGAERITALERKEGSNARVLIFSLDNGRRVVAKLPTSVAGPKRLTTNSEVATIEYSTFRSYCNIDVVDE
jgi:hypothetical protein